MASAMVLSDLDAKSAGHGIIGNSTCISIDNLEEKTQNLIRSGFLWKRNVGQSSTRISSRARFFVLTKSTLEYYRNEKCDKLKGSYPLAMIHSISAFDENSSTMKIELPEEGAVLLQAGDRYNCEQWIQAIQEGIKQWSTVDSEVVDDSVFEMETFAKFPSQLVPRKSTSSVSEGCEDTANMSGEFAMIKYSRAGKASIPHERVFKLDRHNLQIMWRKARKEYSYKSTLEVSKIVEVRCGQQTRNFVQFPYSEVEKQSFSLLFEREQGEWSSLMSLDLICDSVLAAQSWKRCLKALVYGDEYEKPLRSFHETKDPIILYLRRVWATLEHKAHISHEDAASFIQNLSPEVNKRHLKNFIRVYEIYKKYLKMFPDLGLAPQEFMSFLENEQKETNITLKTCVDLIEYHDKSHYLYKRICARGSPHAFQNSRGLLSYHGFLSFLRSKDNSAFDFNHLIVHQDMDHPLSDYFISSSHNTYLTTHQLKGLSSCEAYVRTLQQGSRCLEIDCWDGPDEPVVTHGMTLTTKIKFRDVIQIIKEYAFETNPFPVILSLENHCSEEQQSAMANFFVAEFGDLLATEDLSENNTLPSPNQLLRKIILKGRSVPKKKSRPFKAVAGRQSSVSTFSGFRSWSQVSIQSNASETSKTKLKPVLSSDTINTVIPEDDLSLNAEDVQVPLAGSMSRLIVYCRAVPFKRHDFNENCCEMHSLSENAVMDLIERSPQDIIYISRKKMLRTYPKGSRVESSNFNPMPMWKVGVHMASVNFQKPDAGMHINQGFFRTNGACGYVLKPPNLRKNTTGDFSDAANRNSTQPIVVKIKILGGHFVDTDVIGKSPISLEVEAVGSESKNNYFSTEVDSNYCNPSWKEAEHILDITHPELCILYFKLHSVNRASRLVLQTAIPARSIKHGLRYIPFKTLTGVNLKQSGIFVSISIEEKTENDNLEGNKDGSLEETRRRITTL
ncbi:1-phosphatidylinositol 4,5-bisphosphate phosphodiesterase zeta-1-like isoform X2 [Rhopilema esculentum]|uniref:1-phosphatidylinositol 4,5-bisphosphate phosphodiesterase zeta-1-like isoform X2 n=1 Tax=Rhopilema esculentum TaxID=499914 RepID=UPI0031CF7577